MRNINDLAASILKSEGGDRSMGRNPKDAAAKFPCPTPYKGKKGWHTVEGVTYKTWVGMFGTKQDARFFAMSDEDWTAIFKDRFFDKVKGDQFKSFNVAAVITDIAFLSGVETAALNLQRAVLDCGGKLPKYGADGDIGNETIDAANKIDPATLIRAIVVRRKKFYSDITDEDHKPQEVKNRAFSKGWENRTNRYLTLFMKGI